MLREYHGALGPLVSAFEGTLDQFSGDGIMVFFNDPVPVAGRLPSARSAWRSRCARRWRVAGASGGGRGARFGFGVGIARGYATLGQIGFAERIDYTAIGTVCNLAARLCAEAKDGQILISQPRRRRGRGHGAARRDRRPRAEGAEAGGRRLQRGARSHRARRPVSGCSPATSRVRTESRRPARRGCCARARRPFRLLPVPPPRPLPPPAPGRTGAAVARRVAGTEPPP